MPHVLDCALSAAANSFFRGRRGENSLNVGSPISQLLRLYAELLGCSTQGASSSKVPIQLKHHLEFGAVGVSLSCHFFGLVDEQNDVKNNV